MPKPPQSTLPKKTKKQYALEWAEKNEWYCECTPWTNKINDTVNAHLEPTKMNDIVNAHLEPTKMNDIVNAYLEPKNMNETFISH